MTSAVERQRKTRARRRLGLRPVLVDVSQQTIDWLAARKYEMDPDNDNSVGQAVSAFVSDAILELGP
jgi:hypothetical protein